MNVNDSSGYLTVVKVACMYVYIYMYILCMFFPQYIYMPLHWHRCLVKKNALIEYPIMFTWHHFSLVSHSASLFGFKSLSP